MRKLKIIMWMAALIAFFHVLSYDFAKRDPQRKFRHANDHVKNTELLFIDDWPEWHADVQQVLVPARPFIKPYIRPGESDVAQR